MKKKITATLLATLSIFIIGLSSCKKDEDSAKDKFQNKDYYLTNSIEMENNVVVATYADLDQCEKDDFIRLNSNNTGYYSEGLTKCDPSDEQITNFTWSLSNDDKQLYVVIFFFNVSFNILQNDGTTLRLSTTSIEDGIVYTTELTYVKR